MAPEKLISHFDGRTKLLYAMGRSFRVDLKRLLEEER